jgi:hypothetical protein
MGVGFYWVYQIDNKGLWWSLIVAIAMMIIVTSGVVAFLTPRNACGSKKG